jgi:DNA-binding GntR family transcriptional regulator
MAIARPSTKTNHAYLLIKDDILEGRLAPGTRLRLSELAENFETSEMPVREALRMLQQEGLVSFEDHRGATVADLSMEELLEVIETRTYLEILAVCLASPLHDAASLAELDGLVAKMASETSPQTYAALNHSFHLALYSPCTNTFLKREIDRLWDRAWRRWSKSLYQLKPDRVALATDEHAKIVQALRAGDIAPLEAALRVHRERSLEAWRSLDGPSIGALSVAATA